jgi:hypothetical protein
MGRIERYLKLEKWISMTKVRENNIGGGCKYYHDEGGNSNIGRGGLFSKGLTNFTSSPQIEQRLGIQPPKQ